jgi:hypothetical protein
MGYFILQGMVKVVPKPPPCTLFKGAALILYSLVVKDPFLESAPRRKRSTWHKDISCVVKASSTKDKWHFA